jgi:alpha-beta hydrolase superfamily lysophospholipase
MSVSVDGYLHRMIVTKPRTPGLYPAVFLIGGLGCYSLDNLSPDGTGYGWIIDGFAQAGFVTVRIEKSGEGDSEGPPCTSKVASLKLAADRSIAGINKTATLPFVNAEKIFILAHSVGPVEGALAISKVHVAGFVASETVGTSWFEYTVETARHQQLLLGATYDDVEHEARLTDKCIFFLEVAKESPRRIIRSHPECASYIPVQGGAPYTYFQDLADVNLPTEWKQANVPVLVTYGSSDPLTSSAQSHYLVELVNSFHPGNAEYLLIEGMSHHFDQQPSEASALQALLTGHDGPYLPEFLDRVLEWIRNVK